MEIGYARNKSMEDVVWFDYISEDYTEISQTRLEEYAALAADHAWRFKDGKVWLMNGCVLTIVFKNSYNCISPEARQCFIQIEMEPQFTAIEHKEE